MLRGSPLAASGRPAPPAVRRAFGKWAGRLQKQRRWATRDAAAAVGVAGARPPRHWLGLGPSSLPPSPGPLEALRATSSLGPSPSPPYDDRSLASAAPTGFFAAAPAAAVAAALTPRRMSRDGTVLCAECVCARASVCAVARAAARLACRRAVGAWRLWGSAARGVDESALAVHRAALRRPLHRWHAAGRAAAAADDAAESLGAGGSTLRSAAGRAPPPPPRARRCTARAAAAIARRRRARALARWAALPPSPVAPAASFAPASAKRRGFGAWARLGRARPARLSAATAAVCRRLWARARWRALRRAMVCWLGAVARRAEDEGRMGSAAAAARRAPLRAWRRRVADAERARRALRVAEVVAGSVRRRRLWRRSARARPPRRRRRAPAPPLRRRRRAEAARGAARRVAVVAAVRSGAAAAR